MRKKLSKILIFIAMILLMLHAANSIKTEEKLNCLNCKDSFSYIDAIMQEKELASTRPTIVDTPEYFSWKDYEGQDWTTIAKDQWQSDGSWIGVVELPAGMEEELYDKLNRITHGDIQIEKVN